MANGLTSARGSFRAGTRLAPSKWVGLAKPHNSARVGYRSSSSTGEGDASPRLPRCGGNDQGNGGVPLVVGGFAPQAVLAQMKAVVAGKHDDGAVPQTKLIQFVKDAADLRVHVGRGGIVATAQFANIPRRWFAPAESAQQLTAVVEGDVRTVCRLGQ